jgi:peptidoglycan hydrolase-like protein with peptidoglycan-binding domain
VGLADDWLNNIAGIGVVTRDLIIAQAEADARFRLLKRRQCPMTRKILAAVAAPAMLAATLAASVLSTAAPAAAAPVAANRPVSVAATASFTFAWPVIREGSRGEAVVALQYLLTARGFNPEGVDGIFGPHTRAALMRFQASKKLSVDGVAGNQTWPAVVFEVRPGNTGDGVRAVQSELNANGSHLAVDGIYGPLTRAAAEGFQAKFDLAGALGAIDPATWNALISHGR